MRTDGFEEAQRASGDNVGGVIRDLERNSDMGLSSKVVNLVGIDSINPTAKRRGVGEVRIMELHAGFMGIVGIDVEMVDPLGIEIGRSAYEAVDFVAFVEEEFSEVGTILTSNTSDEGYFPGGGR